MNKNLGSKKIYKTFLGYVKYLPLALLILKLLNITLCYFNTPIILFSFLGGTSLLFLILLFIIAKIFKYCYLYKMPLYYLTATDIFLMVTKVITINTLDIYRIIYITFGIFMTIYIAYAYLTRNKPKRDHIKEFCESYCGC